MCAKLPDECRIELGEAFVATRKQHLGEQPAPGRAAADTPG
jgi:hypothetical protein